MKYGKLLAAAVTLLTLNACNPQERLQTVSDYCLNARLISFEPAPGKDAEDKDEGNQFDTEKTVKEIIPANATYRALCLDKD